MGEKQIEVDKRILRTRMGQLRRSLEDVRTHRKQYRERRAEVWGGATMVDYLHHCWNMVQSQ